MKMADAREAGKGRHAEDPTQCFVVENRLSLETRLGMKMPYLGAVDKMMDSRGTDGFDAARAEVEKRAKEGVGLKIAGDVLGKEDLRDKGLEAVVAAEAREALAGVPVGSERRGPVIAQVLSDRAIEAEARVAESLDDLVVAGRVTHEQAEMVSGYVAGELLRLAALAQEVNRIGEPRFEVIEAVRPIGGIDTSKWNAEVWEGLVKAARGAGAQGEAPREEAEDQTKSSSGEQATGESTGGEWWKNPLVDKAVTLAMGILIEKGGDAADAWLKERHEDRALKREMMREGRPVPGAEPVGPGRQAEAAPAGPAAPVGEQQNTNLQVAERLRDVAEVLKEIKKGSEITMSKFADALERVENAFREQREGDPVSVAVKEYADSLKKDLKCSSCGGPKGPGVCPFCGTSGNNEPEELLKVLNTVLEKTAGKGRQRVAGEMVGQEGAGAGVQAGQPPFNYDSMDFMKRSKLESAQLARAAFQTVERDGDNIYESIPLVPHGEIYYGLTQTEAETLAARIALSNGRARVQQATKTELVFPAPELMAISKASLEALSSMPGVSEATAIYATLITRPDLMRQYQGQMGLPAGNLLDIAEKTELKTYREAFAAYLGERFGLEAQDASNAEAVAYNFCKAFKVPESVDYRFYPEYQRTSRTKLNAVVNDTFRTLLNPAYKMLDAVEKVDDGGNIRLVQKGDRKGWPRNTLGKWIIGNIDGAEGITRVWQEEPLVGNAFCEVDFVDENDNTYKLMEAGGDGRMEGTLIDAAVGLVSGQRNEFHIDWRHSENETPLFLYEFGKIKPAQLIVSMLETLSLPKDTTVEQVEKAFGDLGTVRMESRDVLYKICVSSTARVPLVATRTTFDFGVGGIAGGLEKAGIKRGFDKTNPDFWTLGLPSA